MFILGLFRSCSEIRSPALQVADFLQDQDMVDVAAKAANTCLLQLSRQQSIETFCSRDVLKHVVSALQSLPAHLSQAVVRSGMSLVDLHSIFLLSVLYPRESLSRCDKALLQALIGCVHVLWLRDKFPLIIEFVHEI